eukprot:652770-Pleurochrysis_carterae.AAC.4
MYIDLYIFILDLLRLRRPKLRRSHARSPRCGATPRLGRPLLHLHATIIARIRSSQTAHAYSIPVATLLCPPPEAMICAHCGLEGSRVGGPDADPPQPTTRGACAAIRRSYCLPCAFLFIRAAEQELLQGMVGGVNISVVTCAPAGDAIVRARNSECQASRIVRHISCIYMSRATSLRVLQSGSEFREESPIPPYRVRRTDHHRKQARYPDNSTSYSNEVNIHRHMALGRWWPSDWFTFGLHGMRAKHSAEITYT